MGDILHEFFAVTQRSVYRISDEREEHGWPIVEKIASLYPEDGRSRVGMAVGARLENGHFVGIEGGRYGNGIVLYDQPGTGIRPPSAVNTVLHGGTTTPLMALFLNKEVALRCLNSGGLQCLDPRWIEQTQEVLRLIGKKHPIFIIDPSIPSSLLS